MGASAVNGRVWCASPDGHTIVAGTGSYDKDEAIRYAREAGVKFITWNELNVHRMLNGEMAQGLDEIKRIMAPRPWATC